MLYAISMKVLGQTHMWYVLKHIQSNFFQFFTFYVVLDFFFFFTHTKKKQNGVLSQATKNKIYTPKNICSSASKDRSSRKYLA